MRTIHLLFLAGCLGIAVPALVFTSKAVNKKTTSVSKQTYGFAVVELFTSEGCSSCPPADEVLGEVQEEYKDAQVYILAYHVDYWDRLGWKDKFSRPAFSARQYQYTNWLRLSSAYTPQVVVNGTKEFVGSQGSTLRSVIKTNLKNEIPIHLELKIIENSNDRLEVTYNLNSPAANTSLMISIVERSATTKVLKGENKGRELAHVQIVREQQIILADKKTGTALFNFPAGVDKKDLEVIAFLQNNNTGKITGAAKISIN